MAMIPAACAVVTRSSARRAMDGARAPSLLPRYLSDGGKGRVLSEEERAAENVYIQKMEREKKEKAKQKAEEKKAEKEKETASQKPEGNKS